ncbi:MAG TPA: hypothetical protein VMG38_11235 [Trebonia sp.]|nr:hypothetical protein [Trebonia sp.]
MRQVPAEIAWISRNTRPRDHHVFAGRLEPQLLSLAQRIPLLACGMQGDYRDWDEIAQWAEAIAAELTAACQR